MVQETEIILESTANGVGNYFYQQWRQAEAGMSPFQAIFVPWYWQDEYRKPAKGFLISRRGELSLMASMMSSWRLGVARSLSYQLTV